MRKRSTVEISKSHTEKCPIRIAQTYIAATGLNKDPKNVLLCSLRKQIFVIFTNKRKLQRNHRGRRDMHENGEDWAPFIKIRRCNHRSRKRHKQTDDRKARQMSVLDK